MHVRSIRRSERAASRGAFIDDLRMPGAPAVRMLAAFIACVAPQAQAQVFVCELDNGLRIYQSVTLTGAACARVRVRSVTVDEAMNAGVVQPMTERSAPPSAASAKSIAASPASFPRIDPQTQRKRDLDRREILLQELRAEEDTQRKLQAAYGRTKSAEQRVDLGERLQRASENIAALKRELALVR